MGPGLLRPSLDNFYINCQDVGLGDDPYQVIPLDYRKAADPPFEDNAGSIGNRGVRSYRNHLFRHNLPHHDLLKGVMGVLLSLTGRERRRKD